MINYQIKIAMIYYKKEIKKGFRFPVNKYIF